MPRYGFSGDKPDTKFLILFVLRDVQSPVNLAALTEMVLIDDNADYFVFTDAVTELISSGHLSKSEDGLFSITPKGAEAAQLVENELSVSLRRAAAAAAATVCDRLRREGCIRADVVTTDDGVFAHLVLSDGVSSPLLDLTLYAGTAEQAKLLTKRFHQSAETIYGAVLDAFFSTAGPPGE